MKTRSTKRSRHARSVTTTVPVSVTAERFFLITERGGPNGWVVNAVSPDAALNKFKSEILRSVSIKHIMESPVTQWTEYLEMEADPELHFERPHYMQKVVIADKRYYIEALVLPGQQVAWLPTTFS